MKTYGFIAGLILFCICGGYATPAEHFDFRRTRWGMTQIDVATAEPSEPLLVGKHLLAYEIDLMGHNTNLTYHFPQGLLFEAMYVTNNLSTEKYIKHLNNIKQTLTDKYGKPSTENWPCDSMSANKKKLVQEIRQGKTSCALKWKTPRTNICLSAFGGDNQAYISISYTAPKNSQKLDSF